jgi:hypothetical protein
MPLPGPGCECSCLARPQCRRGKLSLGIEAAQHRTDAGIEEARAAQRYLIAQFAKQFRMVRPIIRWLCLACLGHSEISSDTAAASGLVGRKCGKAL